MPTGWPTAAELIRRSVWVGLRITPNDRGSALDAVARITSSRRSIAERATARG
jgi:hypothetical protein